MLVLLCGVGLTLAEEPLLVQYCDGVGAEDGGLDEGVQGERHAGNFFFFYASSRAAASGQGAGPEIVSICRSTPLYWYLYYIQYDIVFVPFHCIIFSFSEVF